MQFTTLSNFVCLALGLSVSASNNHERGFLGLAHEDAVGLKNHAKRELAMSHLSENVRRALEAQDPSSYTLFARNFVEGGPAHDSEATWDNGHGPGLGHCNEAKIAVTYDDGPYTWHSELSKEWADAGHKINFFSNGYNYGCIYDEANVAALKDSYAAGHIHGSHTWGHVNLTDFLTPEEINKQISLVEDAYYKILGIVPRLLRPPYGETNKTLNKYLRKRWGLSIIQWDLDAGDASGVSPEDTIAMYMTFKKGDSHIVLNHETHQISVEQVAPAAIEHFKKEGIKTAKVNKCLKKQPYPYKVIGSPSSRDSTWTCDDKPLPGQKN